VTVVPLKQTVLFTTLQRDPDRKETDERETEKRKRKNGKPECNRKKGKRKIGKLACNGIIIQWCIGLYGPRRGWSFFEGAASLSPLARGPGERCNPSAGSEAPCYKSPDDQMTWHSIDAVAFCNMHCKS